MRALPIIILFVVATIQKSHSQTSDYSGIEKTVSYYLEGGTNNNFETLKKAFHENATMKFIRNGEYKEVKVIPYFKKAMRPGPKQDRITKISRIDISGNVANAKIELIYGAKTYVDYMNLIKIDGIWKIVGKIYSKK